MAGGKRAPQTRSLETGYKWQAGSFWKLVFDGSGDMQVVERFQGAKNTCLAHSRCSINTC